MDIDTNNNQNSNVNNSFIKAWLYIFLLVLRGLKFVVLDLWVIIFNFFSYNLSKVFTKQTPEQQTEKKDGNTNLAAMDLYEKTKQAKRKRVKEYHYSQSKLDKLARMKIELENDLQTAGATRSKVANIYKFIVRDKKNGGKIFSDVMPGFSKLDINSFLVNEGYEVFSIETSDQLNFVHQNSDLFSQKISTKDLVFWLTQLSTYLKAGITLSEGVNILSMQVKGSRNNYKKRTYRSIRYELSLGESFSNALEKQGNYFPALLINMIKAAEASGTLQETLEDMANYYTEVNNTRKEMKSALTYPTIISIFSIAVMTFIVIYVVPQFTQIYAQSNIQITGLTAAIVNFSTFLTNNIFTVFLIFILIFVVIILAYKKIKAFKVMIQLMFMHIPVVKDVIIYKELTIFAKTFASLLKNNVFITESIDILSKITNNEIYKAIMFKTIDNIVKGDKISEAFEDHWAVPDIAYHMIETGEETGRLAEMMQKVSDYYQVQHKSIVNLLKSFIEPVMIIFLAIAVAIIVIAVIVPMFSLYNKIL